jgi:hypothetical protein
MTKELALGANVEIIHPLSPGDELIDLDHRSRSKPSHIFINGIDVGSYERGSLHIDPGVYPDRAMKVTVTLLVNSVTVRTW